MAKAWTEDEALLGAVTENLYTALPLLPKRLVRVDQITKEFGMPFSHIQILCMLSEGSMSIGMISNSLGIAKPNITPLLDNMRERGLLERHRSESDRRIVNVSLLPKGEEMAEQLKASIGAQVTEWPACFNHSEMKRLNNALACLIGAAKKLSEMESK